MATIKEDFGSGLQNLIPNGAGGSPDLATALRDIADDLTARSAVAAPAPTAAVEADVSQTYGQVDGLITGAPTTPSSQAVDPGGFSDWNVNISAGFGFANAVGKYNAAQVDVNISTGAKILNIGQAMYAWLVWAEAGGVVTQTIVLGTAAVSGAETIPNDAAITAGVGHARWFKLALCHAHRSADAVITTTQDPSYMLKWAGAAAPLVNELKTKFNIAVTLLTELRTQSATALKTIKG